jgi:acetolactate synthase-1/2/3 large subunit
MKGADIFVESLLREGVDTIFGHPGGAILPLNDALYSGKIRHILTRHEQGAVHMAEGYARATGRPGVVLVTSGPGGTNVVTGLTNAALDSTPLVVFTGQVPTAVIGNDAFQEADIVGITRSCTKHNYLVNDVKDLARTVKEAFYIASTGRPGPVLVDIPKDVSTGSCEFVYPESVSLRGYKPTIVGHAGQLRRAAEMLAVAQRPIIYAGGGVIHSGGAEELRQLGELTATPVTNTPMGRGGVPGVHDLWLGMLGMHGTVAANTAMDGADLVIAIGARFDDRVTGNLEEFCVGAKFIHIDIDPSSIGKNVRVDLPIVGDVKHCLRRLLECAPSRRSARDHQAWLAQVET